MKKLLLKTGLNSKELWVIGFLLFSFAAGLVIKYSGWKKPEEQDYSQVDKNFEEKLKNSFEDLKPVEKDSISDKRADELLSLAESLSIDAEKTGSSITKIKPGTMININTAGVQELIQLPGIGEVTAEKIIEYRETRQKFLSTDELMNVKGIGSKKFEALKNFITVK